MSRTIEAVVEVDGRVTLKQVVLLDQPHRAIVAILGPVDERADAVREETASTSEQPPPDDSTPEEDELGEDEPDEDETEPSDEQPLPEDSDSKEDDFGDDEDE